MLEGRDEMLEGRDEKMLEGRGKNWRPIDINIDRSSPSDTLAQLVECGASNAKVPGLNPGWSVMFFLLSFMLCGRKV